ncbi:unnamed protein product [Cyprideis torosa]|uniref:Uncharacterized protein n=1 Tax=Cyprideis torosa TaxID=163714 RepID=A0A7R8ZKQ3_9CRUS|nr:unnamed protein product [Cyprideis torosa]CAG0882093.1 unnamed protein product [Cyprideis torosa]
MNPPIITVLRLCLLNGLNSRGADGGGAASSRSQPPSQRSGDGSKSSSRGESLEGLPPPTPPLFSTHALYGDEPTIHVSQARVRQLPRIQGASRSSSLDAAGTATLTHNLDEEFVFDSSVMPPPPAKRMLPPIPPNVIPSNITVFKLQPVRYSRRAPSASSLSPRVCRVTMDEANEAPRA